MVWFNIYLVLVAFFASTLMVRISANLDPLEKCREQIGLHCGQEVYDKVVLYHKNSVSQDCCYKLVQMGQSCHTNLVKDSLSATSESQKPDVPRILSRSNKVFKKCQQVTKPADDKILSNCKEKIGTRCGKEVFDRLVFDKPIKNVHCCGKLVEMGHSCHTDLVKEIILTNPELRKKTASRVLAKSDKIFNTCKHVSRDEDGKVLDKCRERIGAQCAKQIYNSIIIYGKRNITKNCCHELVQLGHACHTKLVKHEIFSKHEFTKDAEEKFLAKSEIIFGNCKKILH